MSQQQQELLDCPICYEKKEKKDFFPLKCCGNSLCNQCEPQVRQTHSAPLPGHPNHLFIRCPLCREMESVPFDLATQLVSTNFRRNFQEFYINMSPGFHLTPEQQFQRNGREIRALVELQQRRQLLEREERERRIQQERERIQHMERQEQENRYGANLLAAMRNMDPRRLFRRRQRLEEPIQENMGQPGLVVLVVQQPPTLRVPNNPTLRVPPPQVPQPTARRRESTPPPQINLIARRQPRIAAPMDQPNRSQLCHNINCYHRTVFRCQIHTNVPCCRHCLCPQCQ